MDIWNDPIGQSVNLGQAPATDNDIATAAEVLAQVGAHLPTGTRLEQAIWCGRVGPAVESASAVAGSGAESTAAAAGAGQRLWVSVAARSASGRVVTLRLHRVGPDGTTGFVADLRCRRQGGAAQQRYTGKLLTEPVLPGASCTRRFQVVDAMTTGHVPNAAPVLSTPMLIGLMEDTAADTLRPSFVDSAASLGTWIGVRHTGPAHVGQEVTVTAVVADVHGRRYLFDVEATVDGRSIGDGQVAQTLIRT